MTILSAIIVLVIIAASTWYVWASTREPKGKSQ